MTTNVVHFVLQGKGGVGKTLIACFLAQYFMQNGSVKCFDTDPVNDTFSQYIALSAERINILDSHNNINSRVFDSLIEKLLETNEVAVVDNGASTFVPLMAYMIENNVVDFLQKNGKKVYIHTVITGGQALTDTLNGLSIMLDSQKASIVVWLNGFFGDIVRDGKSFDESKTYLQHKGTRIIGLVNLERGNPDTFGTDMEMMIKDKLTFEQALSSPNFSLMPRQRLKILQTALFDQLDSIEF